MFKYILSLLIFIVLVTSVSAQELNGSDRYTGSGNINGGQYSYTCNIHAKSWAPGMGDVRYALAISSFVINSFEVDGVSASSLSGVDFPLKLNNPHADVEFSLTYFLGTKSITFENLKMGYVESGTMDYGDLTSSQVQALKEKFDLRKTSDFNGFTLIFRVSSINQDYLEVLSGLRSRLNEKIRNENEIDKLKEELNVLGYDLPSLERKRAIYSKLRELEPDTDYSSLENLNNNRIDQLRLAKLKQEMNKTMNPDKEEKEESRTQSSSNTSSYSSVYNETKRQVEQMRKNGQTNTQEYRDALKSLRTSEQIMGISGPNSYSTNVAAEDLGYAVADALNGMGDTSADGGTRHLSVGYSFNFINELDLTYTGRLFWGKFFLQLDLGATYGSAKGWERDIEYDVYNSNVSTGDLIVTDYKDGTDILYRKGDVNSYGGKLGVGMGFGIPLGRSGNTFLNIGGLGGFRASTTYAATGYGGGIEFVKNSIVIGIHYDNYKYKFTIQGDDVIYREFALSEDFKTTSTYNGEYNGEYIDLFTYKGEKLRDAEKKILESYIRLSVGIRL